MNKVTPAQMRKIYALAHERGMDGELLHIHVTLLTRKDSIKDLSIQDAILVIDSLSGKRTGTPAFRLEAATMKQCRYIEVLARELGWINDENEVDTLRVNGFVKAQYSVERYQWLTKAQASNMIEALKGMLERLERIC